MTRPALIALMALTLSAQAFGQTEEDARRLARGFVDRLGVEADLVLTSAPDDWMWIYDSEACSVTVDKRTGKVNAMFTDTGRSGPAYEPDAVPVVKDAEDAIQRSREWAARAGIELPLLRDTSVRHGDDATPDRITQYTVTFAERPYGYGGKTNSHAIGLDAYSGKITDYTAQVGITYDPPVVSLTKQQALEIAKQNVQQAHGVELTSSTVSDPRYAGDKERTGDDRRRVRLVYGVVGQLGAEGSQQVSVLVDAESGRVLDSGVSKSDNPTVKQVAETPASSASGASLATPDVLALAVAGLCTLSLGAVLAYKAWH